MACVARCWRTCFLQLQTRIAIILCGTYSPFSMLLVSHAALDWIHCLSYLTSVFLARADPLLDAMLAADEVEDESEGGQDDNMNPVDNKKANQGNKARQTAPYKRSKEAKEAARRNFARRAAGGDAVTSKWCTGCFQDKELDKYGEHSRSLLGRRAQCTECINSAERQKKREKAGRSRTNTGRCWTDTSFCLSCSPNKN